MRKPVPAHSLDGLMKWLRRDEWRDAFADTLDEHVGPACEEAGIENSELSSVLDDHAMGNLWGCAFEDFLTREDDEGRNIADDYLKGRGWKESVSDRRYIVGLRHSVMSLYEVSGIERGVSFLARDLVRGGDPVLVSEHSATKSLQQWDRIGARLIDMGGGKTIMAGGVLAFDRETSEELLKGLKTVTRKLPKERKQLAAKAGLKPDDPRIALAMSIDAMIRLAAPLFSTTWLMAELDRLLDPASPIATNSDGEDLAFVSVSFPFAPNVKAAAVRAALDRLPDLRPENDSFWNWVRPNNPEPKPAGKAKKADTSVSLVSTMDDGALVLGSIETARRFVILEANSVERGQRGLELLKTALGPLAMNPVVQTKSVGQVRQSPRAAKDAEPLDLPPEEMRQLVHAAMEQHYRKQLDEPVPSLGNISPRQAARTKAGREKVVGWLKYLENNTGRVGKSDPMASFDFGWMWQELGVEDRRR